MLLNLVVAKVKLPGLLWEVIDLSDLYLICWYARNSKNEPK